MSLSFSFSGKYFVYDTDPPPYMFYMCLTVHHMFAAYSSQSASFHVRDQVSYPYKKTEQINTHAYLIFVFVDNT